MTRSIHRQASLPIFAALCLAASIGLALCRHGLDVKSTGSSPDPKTAALLLDAKSSAPAGSTPYPELAIAGASLELGSASRISFSTDQKGRAIIPVSVSKSTWNPGSTYNIAMLYPMKHKNLLWVDRKELLISDLRPNSTYEIEAALWLRNPESGQVWTDPGKIADCGNSCLLALGMPVLKALGKPAAPIERVAVAALAPTPSLSPLLLALGLGLWRLGGRRYARSALTAFGIGANRIALPVKPPKVG